MSNWIEGTFRFRGLKENVKKFIMEGLQPSFRCEEKLQRKIEFEEDDYIEIKFTLNDKKEDSKKKYPDYLYIPHTSRTFVELDSYGYISANKCEKSNDLVCATNFKATWSIDTEAIVKVAKEYQIDIRINGYERGMRFEQLVEVNRRGVIRCESVIQYEDYIWECPMPLLGG